MNPEREGPPEGEDFEFPEEQEQQAEFLEVEQPEAREAELLKTLEDFVDEETEVIPPPSDKKPAKSRLSRAILGVTIGLVLAMGNPEARAQKINSTEKDKIELQIQKLQSQLEDNQKAERKEAGAQRMQELNEWVKAFNVEGLRISEPKSRVRSPGEQVGIYLEQSGKPEKHLGDIYAGRIKIEKVQLLREVGGMLQAAEIDATYEAGPEISAEAGFEVDMDLEANAVLESWGGGMKDNELKFGKSSLITFDKNTESLTVMTAGKTKSGEQILIVHCSNKDGSKDVVKITKDKILDLKGYK